MNDIDRIDKEVGLIKLTVGQVCSAGIAHNIYTGDRKLFATPFIHKVTEIGRASNGYVVCEEKEVGLVIRIANDGTIIGNPSYRGNAIISFVSKEFGNTRIHTCRITKINKRSVNVEPIEYEPLTKEA